MEFAELSSKIEGIRWKARALFMTDGMLRTLVLLLFTSILTFFLDRNLILPQGARGILVLLFLIFFSYTLVARTILPALRGISPDRAALAVERKAPHLKDCLISSLQLNRLAKRDDFYESRVLVAKMTEETLAALKKENFKRVLMRPGLKKRVFLLILLGLLAGVYAVQNPQKAEIWWKRSVLLQNIPWPQRTFLEVILPKNSKELFLSQDDEGTIINIAKGIPLTILAKAAGEVPSRVDIHMEEVDLLAGELIRDRRMMTQDSEDRFFYHFIGLTRSFRFYVTGGDDLDSYPLYRVRILDPPALESVKHFLAYLPYTQLAPEAKEGGSVEAPLGTLVRIEAKVDREGIQGRLEFKEGGERVLKQQDGGILYAQFRVERNDHYRVLLEEEKNGLRNVDPPLYTVRVVQDQKPKIKVLSPKTRAMEVTPKGVVPLRFEVWDDFGVGDARLFFKVQGVPPPPGEILLREEHIQSREGLGREWGAKRLVLRYFLDLASLEFPVRKNELAAGEVLEVTVEVRDQCEDLEQKPAPNLERADLLRLRILDVEEFQRRLLEYQVRIKNRILQIQKSVEELRIRGEELLPLLIGEKAMGKEISRRALGLEIAQGRITGDLKRVAQEIRDLFSHYVFNRLATANGNTRVLQRLMNFEGKDWVEEYGGLVEDFKDGRFGEAFDLEKLFHILGLILDLSERDSPGASEVLGKIRRAGSPGSAADLLREGLAREEKILTTLRELLKKMDDWEDFQDVIQITRILVEQEEGIARRIKERIEDGK